MSRLEPRGARQVGAPQLTRSALRLSYLAISVTLCGGFVAPVLAQETAPAFTVGIGAGNTFGGVGFRGEAHALRGHVSFLAGAGVFMASPGTDPIITAMALRCHIGGSQHSMYAGISRTYVTLYGDDLIASGVSQIVEYGWGIGAGYRFVAPSGLTTTVGGGVGQGRHAIYPLLEMGIGWTWWRRTRA